MYYVFGHAHLCVFFFSNGVIRNIWSGFIILNLQKGDIGNLLPSSTCVSVEWFVT